MVRIIQGYSLSEAGEITDLIALHEHFVPPYLSDYKADYNSTKLTRKYK